MPLPLLGNCPDPGSNPGLPHRRQTLYHLGHKGVNNHNWRGGASTRAQKREVQRASSLAIQKASMCQAPNSTGTEAPVFGTLPNLSPSISPSGSSFILFNILYDKLAIYYVNRPLEFCEQL